MCINIPLYRGGGGGGGERNCSVGGIEGCLNFKYGHRHYICVMCIVYV